MLRNKHYFTRAVKLITALVISISALAVPIVMSGSASAGVVTTRSVEITNSAGAASGVGYTVTFTMATSGASVGGVVVMFCSNSPIIGSSCTAPAGFDSKTSTTLSSITGTGFTTFTKDTVGAGSGALTNVFQVDSATPGTATATPTVVITIAGVVNPTATNTSFYARIIVYDTQAHSQASTATSTTGAIDQGGAALSTGYTIQITATVQESLTFCVSGTGPLASCASPAAPTLIIGHGTPTIVDNTAVDSVPVYMWLSTNAGGNVVIRMKADAAGYGTLYNANHSFTAANAGSSSNPGAAQTAGTEFFGFNMTTACTGACAAQAPYAAGAGYYGLDTTSGTNNVTLGFGSPVANITTATGTY
jgi:hypothetical protein